MIRLIEDNLDEIVKICEKMQVSLYLFGSARDENNFTKNSDLDFLYRFKKDENSFSLSKYDYFDLMFALENTIGKKVDLVAEDKIKNKFFLARVNEEKIKIYEP